MPSLREIQSKLKEIADLKDQALVLLNQAKDNLSDLAQAQQESFDNMPESLQESTNGQNSQERANDLEEKNDALESIISEIEDLDLTMSI